MRFLFIFVFFPFIAVGQAFTFSNQQTTREDDTFPRTKTDTFEFKINNDRFVITDWGEIFKYRDHKLIAETLMDFGYMYEIHEMGYLIYDKRIYFLFFIRENGKDYAALYSFRYEDLEEYKRLHFRNYYELKSSSLNGNSLQLAFSNKTYRINLDRGLKNGRKNFYIE